MAPNIPAECPSCAATGLPSAVVLYQINLDEAAVLCENPSCVFPLLSGDICPLVVSRPLSLTSSSISMSKSKTKSMDTDSMTSSCSVSSWASHASTVSSISSSLATPPPLISSKPFSWPSNQATLVYQPKAIVPKQKNVLDWITPVSSTQSSPALSIKSVNDKEVELMMTGQSSYTPNSGLTPSPSPLLSELLDTGSGQTSDDIDDFIQSISFLDEILPPQPTQVATSVDLHNDQNNCLMFMDSQSSNSYTELVPSVSKGNQSQDSKLTTKNSKDLVISKERMKKLFLKKSASMRMKTGTELPNPTNSARGNVTSRTEDQNCYSVTTDSQSNPNGGLTTPVSAENHIQELPVATKSSEEVPNPRKRLRGQTTTNSSAKRSKVAAEPSTQTKETEARTTISQSGNTSNSNQQGAPVSKTRGKGSRKVNGSSSEGETTPSISSSSATPALKPQIALDINADGTPVFTIHPIVPTPVPAPAPAAKKPRNSSAPRRKYTKKSTAEEENSKKKGDDSKKKTNKTNPFCIETLVQKFIQAAKNRKLPDPKPA